MVIVGTGGQGLITLLQIISEAALAEGYDIRTSELHGLSQRGGSVQVHIRFGKKIFSPLVAQNKADFILALEAQEVLRGIYFASSKTKFLINQLIIPIPLLKPLSESEILNELKKVSNNITVMPADKICQEKLQNSVVSGIYLMSLAAFKDLMPLSEKAVESAIKKIIPEKFLELNLKAFNLAKP